GHCIPIDPFYLTWKARAYDLNTRFIELAGEVNTDMPRYVVQRTIEALNAHKKSMNGSRILIMGIAYKPNVDDDRESPSYKLMDMYMEMGAEVSYFDPHVPEIRHKREYPQWTGMKSIKWDQVAIRAFDVVVIATDHADVNYEELGAWAVCIVDTRNAMHTLEHPPYEKVWKA
ncbi:UDP binding domain-containing protein, partial [Balneolaceae bacterium ANBcel3]|nr:UDP binding domain-containing protein [Balneolaceae bacterium ANBcel3]